MHAELRLLAVLAHPDDESLGLGGSLARYAREGIGTYVLTATRGERGRYGDAAAPPPMDVVGRTREEELRSAARVLGVREVRLLDYVDGDLDRADPAEATARIAEHVRRIRPQVVVTFGPDGGYGHPDHIAISQFTTSALLRAADGADPGSALPPHRASKLYYMEWPPEKWEAYQETFKRLRSVVDGVEREARAWPEWMITTVVDTTAYWPVVWEAIRCHKTQLAIYSKLADLPEDRHRILWGSQEFYRAMSLVNGGRAREADLFEGLR